MRNFAERVLAVLSLLVFAGLQAGCGLFSGVGLSASSPVLTDSEAHGQLLLPSRIVVNNSPTVEIEITCTGTSKEFLIINNTLLAQPSTSPPEITDAAWQACPVTPSVITTPVVNGQNQIQIWFKSDIGVSPEPQPVTAHKTESYTFHLPEAELGSGNGSAYTPIELTPTLFAISDPNNDVNGANAGAVHLLNQAGEVQTTLRGSFAGDRFGYGTLLANGKILKLTNGRFAVISPYSSAAAGSILEAGQVAVFDYSGNLIFKIEGDNAGDRIGWNAVLELSNGNLVIASSSDDVGGLTDAGSVLLVNGTTGAIISRIEGDVANDQTGKPGFGFQATRQLASGLVLIHSVYDSVFGGLAGVGSIRFMNPDTGAIVSTIQGDNAGDALGFDGIETLASGTLVIRSFTDDVPSYPNGGSVMFVNPTNGAVLQTINGGSHEFFLGNENVVELANGNLVVYSGFHSLDGRAILIDGVSFAVIATLVGTGAGFTNFSDEGIVALGNGNFVVVSSRNEPTGVFGQGSATLVNGVTGAVITNVVGDIFGGFQMNAMALENGNFVAAFPSYGAADEGRMYIVNGTTGAILNTINGSTADDFTDLDSSSSLEYYSARLPNGNFLLRLPSWDVNGLVDAGCARFYNGTTGALLSEYCGDEAGDRLGAGSARALSNGNVLFGSGTEIIGGAAVGRAQLINGNTGTLIQTYDGATAGDQLGNMIFASNNGNAAIVAPNYDVGGIINAGRIIVINGTTGAILSTIDGETAQDSVGGGSFTTTASGDFLVNSSGDDVDGKVNSGSVMLIDKQTGLLKFSVSGPTAGDGTIYSTVLSNGDYLLQAYGSDSMGISNSGAYILVPMD